MSTVSEIVNQAYREGNFVAVGELPTAAEVSEAIPLLNRLISSFFGHELGELVREWPAPAVGYPTAPIRWQLTPTGPAASGAEPWIYPPGNVRMIVSITSAKTIYFPVNPQDGARISYVDVGSTAALTLDGNGRTIEEQTSITGSPPADGKRTWFYRADLGDWIQLKTLVAADDVPLPEEFDDLFITGLAIRIAPRYGVKMDESVVARFVDMIGRAKHRFKQTEGYPVAETQVFPEI